MGNEMQRELRAMEENLDRLSDMADAAIKKSLVCFFKGDPEGAKEVIAGDIEINNLRFEINKNCVRLTATQQPVARDVREIFAVHDITTELERMGDYAEGIARVVLQLQEFDYSRYSELLSVLKEMEIKALDMLEKSMEAFFARDAEQSRAVCHSDDEVDTLYRKAIEIIHSVNESADVAMRLSWVAHNIERIADRATNIAEQTYFLVTGKMEEIGSSKY